MNLNLESNKHDRRLGTISALLALAIIGAIVLLSRQPVQPPDLECYEDQTETMTVQQVADLLETPLIELTWLPQDFQTTPRIRTHLWIFGGSAECNITIDYPITDSPMNNVVSIRLNHLGMIQPTKTTPRCSWHFTPSGPTGTDCQTEVDGLNSTLRVYIDISPELPPEAALQILDGIKVVEPTK